MAPSALLGVSVLLLLTITVDSVKVIVGDPFEFPTCNRGQSGSLRLNLGLDGTRPVADFRSGEWRPRGYYRDRIRENSSTIVFTRTRYTDGGGIYELTCGKTEPHPVQLQVVFAAEVSVTRGETALLPCYFNIKPGSPVIWESNGSVLCELKSGSDVCDRRLSVSQDWFSHGDLSLTIDQAQPEDQGDYYCFTQDEQSGSPAAVRLEVREQLAVGELVTGVLKETVELPARICPVQNTLTRPLRDGGSLVLGTLVNGAWIPEDGFRERTELSPAGVSLKDLTYNDNGFYEFSCGGDVLIIRLDVVTMSNLSVTEGLTARLSCYCHTQDKDNVGSVKWIKDNQLVLELHLPGGEVDYGDGYEGRVSVPDWESGDVSLVLNQVQLKDRGDFFCSVPENRGTSTAVRLMVPQHSTTPSKETGSTSAAPLPPPAPADKPDPWMIAFCSIVPVSALGFTLLGWILHGRKLCSSAGRDAGKEEKGSAALHINGVSSYV